MQDNSEKVINDHDIRIGLSDTTNLIEQSAYHYSLQEEKRRISTVIFSITNRCRRYRSTIALCR